MPNTRVTHGASLDRVTNTYKDYREYQYETRKDIWGVRKYDHVTLFTHNFFPSVYVPQHRRIVRKFFEI